jgi:hypothetical protein
VGPHVLRGLGSASDCTPWTAGRAADLAGNQRVCARDDDGRLARRVGLGESSNRPQHGVARLHGPLGDFSGRRNSDWEPDRRRRLRRDASRSARVLGPRRPGDVALCDELHAAARATATTLHCR